MASRRTLKIQEYKGLIAAPFTAFKKNGSINPDVIPEYVDYLVKLGVKGVFVNGTTGEGLSLTVEERKTIAAKWVEEGKNKFEVIIIQIGANSIEDAKELAKHAEQIEPTGIAALPPFFYKPPTHEHLVAYMKSLSECAPNLPIMLYHIPSFSGVEIQISEFLPKARRAIPNFCGAKFTSVDVRDLLACHRIIGSPFKLLNGFDEVLLPALACGVSAAVGATYNFMAPLGLKVMKAYEKGDLKTATEYQQKISNAVERIVSSGPQSISTLKATMNILSRIDFGAPRAPLLPLTPMEMQKLQSELARMNATTWAQI